MKKGLNIILVLLGIGAILYFIYRRRPDVDAPVTSFPLLGGQVDITRSKTQIQNDVVARLKLPPDTGAKRTKKTGFLRKVTQSKIFKNVIKPVASAGLNLVAPGSGTLFSKL